MLELGGAILTALSPILQFLGSIFIGALIGAFSIATSVISGAISAITGIIGGLASFISGVVNLISGILTGNWSQAFNGAKSIVEGVVSVISWTLHLKKKHLELRRYGVI